MIISTMKIMCFQKSRSKIVLILKQQFNLLFTIFLANIYNVIILHVQIRLTTKQNGLYVKVFF